MGLMRREYRTHDKRDWGPGPWQDEPDKIQWKDEITGFPCLMVRNHSGAWCGYVGVAEGHPWFGKFYDDVEAHAHGGLTFSGHCQVEPDPARGVCHIPEPGDPDNVWWLGFDCSHHNDYAPASAILREIMKGCPYRDQEYVTRQVTRLAVQAADARTRIKELTHDPQEGANHPAEEKAADQAAAD